MTVKMVKTWIILPQLLLVTVVRGNDFISHVEETLISHDDDWTHRQAIGELEEAFAYGDKSRFRYERIKLFDKRFRFSSFAETCFMI